MASVATKIAFFTTLALGRELSTTSASQAAVEDVMTLVNGMITDLDVLQNQRNFMNLSIGSLET